MSRMVIPRALEDFPDLVLVLDRDDRERPFWLRAKTANGAASVDIGREATLPGAVRAAERLGFSPTHWMERTDRMISPIPDSVNRKPT